MGEGIDWLGLRRRYRRETDGVASSSLWELAVPGARLDRRGVLSSLGSGPETARSCVEGISVLPRPAREGRGDGSDLSTTLLTAMERVLRRSPAPMIALSGGVDSAILLALVRFLGLPMPPLLTLVTGWHGYDEHLEARSLARAFGASVEEIPVTEEEYLLALPDVIRAVEAPLYNLHPVSRLLLARAAHGRGGRTLVTGDGADQVFADRSPHLYLPLIEPLTEAGGLRLASPFFDTQLHRASGPASPDKAPLRALARSLGVPAMATDAPKRPRMTPALNLDAVWREAAVERAARAVGLTVRRKTDLDRVRFATLGLFAEALDGIAAPPPREESRPPVNRELA